MGIHALPALSMAGCSGATHPVPQAPVAVLLADGLIGNVCLLPVPVLAAKPVPLSILEMMLPTTTLPSFGVSLVSQS